MAHVDSFSCVVAGKSYVLLADLAAMQRLERAFNGKPALQIMLEQRGRMPTISDASLIFATLLKVPDDEDRPTPDEMVAAFGDWMGLKEALVAYTAAIELGMPVASAAKPSAKKEDSADPQ